jgi:hypothetical protein
MLSFSSLYSLADVLVAAGEHDETARKKRLADQLAAKEKSEKRKREKEAAGGGIKKRKHHKVGKNQVKGAAAGVQAEAGPAPQPRGARANKHPRNHMLDTYHMNYDGKIDRDEAHRIDGATFVATEDSFGVSRNMSQIFSLMFLPVSRRERER